MFNVGKSGKNLQSSPSTPQNCPHTNYSRQRSIAIKPRFKSSVKFKKINCCFSDKKQLVDFAVVKELDEETNLYYYGARYLDPRTSRWIAGDPAIWQGDYIPVAPTNDEARKHNQNLPGMGGIFNIVNMHTYHYAGNNPVKYVDPDGRQSIALPVPWSISIPRGIIRPWASIIDPLPIIVSPSIGDSTPNNTPTTISPEGIDWNDPPSGPSDLGPEWGRVPGSERAPPEHRNQFRHRETGRIIRWDENGRHWHRINPNSRSRRDAYLDKYGNPVSKDSPAGHIKPRNVFQRFFDSIFTPPQRHRQEQDNSMT